MAENFTIVKNPHGKASVWQHFGFVKESDIVDKKRVACKLCRTILKYSSNTTNLNDHLRRWHPSIGTDTKSKTDKSKTSEKLSNPSSSSTNPTSTLATIFPAKISPTSQRGKSITSAISQFIVRDLRPYSIVENIGFKNLIHVLEPKYTIPSRQHFSDKMIPQIYDDVKDKLKSEVKDKFVSLTTDGWTSRATESYITITSCHIDSKWELKNYVLQTRAMTHSHTGSNIAEVLNEAVAEWGLKPNPPIVSDNATNMAVAAKEFGSSLHVGCFAHTLNLACGRALKLNKVSKLLARMRRIVAYFHRSSSAAAILKQKQELLQLPAHKLIIDVQTRWNSALDMTARFLEQQPAIYASLTSKELRGKEKDISTLTETDISEAEELVIVLTPLKTATTVLCEESIPTISMVLPLQHQLVSNIMMINDQDTNLIKAVKSAVVNDLSGRYCDTNVKQELILTSLLDPRFKLAPFLSNTERIEAFHNLTRTAVLAKTSEVVVKSEPKDDTPQVPSENPILPSLPTSDDQSLALSPNTSPTKKKIKQEVEDTTSPVRATPSTASSAMSSLFGDVYITNVEEPKSVEDLCEEGVKIYQKEAPINAADNPLKWWYKNCEKFPTLALLAKRYLCIPATSVPAERVFSTAGDIVTAQRSALKPDKVDKLIFLKTRGPEGLYRSPVHMFRI